VGLHPFLRAFPHDFAEAAGALPLGSFALGLCDETGVIGGGLIVDGEQAAEKFEIGGALGGSELPIDEGREGG
jgi:hypothetical protein